MCLPLTRFRLHLTWCNSYHKIASTTQCRIPLLCSIADSLTWQSATPCRSARPHRYPDAGRQTASGLESAVELRQGEKSARQSQNLVGFAQFSNFALQHFYPVALGTGNAIAHASVDLVFTDPIMQGLGNTADLGGNGLNGCPQGRILATVFEHHAYRSLRCGSLHEIRGDSIYFKIEY